MKKLNSTSFLLEVAALATTFLIVIGVYYFGVSKTIDAPPPIPRREIIPTEQPKLQTIVSKEDAMKTFITSYLSDLQSKDWQKKIPAYFLPSNFEGAIQSHQKFRKAFADYKIAIKHLAFDKNEAILWLKVSAKHVGKYDENELRDVTPSGKKIEWDEVWDFEIQDGKFIGQGDFLDAGISRMKQLGVKCLPEK